MLPLFSKRSIAEFMSLANIKWRVVGLHQKHLLPASPKSRHTKGLDPH